MTTEILSMFYPLILFVLITAIIVVVIWQGASIAKARMSVAREEAYRKLSEQAAGAEQISAEAQQKTAEALEDIRTRLAAIEKLLRDVE
jgi:hypothetical protein